MKHLELEEAAGPKLKISLNDIDLETPVLKSPLIKQPEKAAAPKLKMMSRHSSLKSLKSPSVNGGTPKSVKFCEEPPTKISPKPFLETQKEDDLDFLLKKIKSMKKVKEVEDTDTTMTDTTMNASNAEASFALPSKLDLPDLSRDHDNSDPARDLLKVSSLDVDSLNFNFQDDLEMDTSILASHGGDFTLTQPKMDTIQKSKRDMSNEETTMAVLQHQSTLLEKDKLIANLWEELQIKEAERLETLKNINAVEESNIKMELVVEECERTITQLGFEKERELGLLMESKEKAAREHEQANEDFKVVFSLIA